MTQRNMLVPLWISISLLSGAILACSGASGLPNPFASATPTVTETFTPTVTASPTPSPTPTLTPTATPVPNGMVIHNTPGGGSEYLDYDAGIAIDIPAQWVAVRLEPDDIQTAVSQVGPDNPSLAKALENALQSKSANFRIFAFDKSSKDSTAQVSTNFSVAISQGSMAIGLPLDMVVQSSLQQIKAQMPNVKVRDLGDRTNANGIQLYLIEVQPVLKRPDGSLVRVYEKEVYFQTKTVLVAITLATSSDKADTVTPEFDAIMDQIRLMTP